MVPISYLRTQAAAQYTGLSTSTLAKLRLSGRGAVYSKLGRAVVYAVEDLDAWLAQNRRRSTSEKSAVVTQPMDQPSCS